MKTRIYLFSCIITMLFTLYNAEAQISSQINPDSYDISQNPGDPYTIITWNDATSVTRITTSFWGYEFDLDENTDYSIIDIDGQTALLKFTGYAKQMKDQKALNFDFICTIYFNIGDSSIFTIIPVVELLYGVNFWVVDPLGNDISEAVITFDGITLDPGEYFAGMFAEGHYEYTVSKPGYQTHTDMIYVDNPVSETITLYPDSTSFIPETEQHLCFVYPNPASEMIYFDGGNVDFQTYKIISATGEILITGNHLSRGIDISILKNGLYYIIITKDNQQQVVKFLKN